MTEMPRTMGEEAVRRNRREMLSLKHIAPLAAYVADLRNRTSLEIPDFDPADGGRDAEILFVFEKPGPMAAGSGFISCDNDDPTAEATLRFLNESGIDRKRIVIWNMVPGWNGTRRITRKELAMGREEMLKVVSLLPEIHSVVLVGRKAQRLREVFMARGLRVFTSAHPSPIVRATRPNDWASIPQQWRAAKLIKGARLN